MLFDIQSFLPECRVPEIGTSPTIGFIFPLDVLLGLHTHTVIHSPDELDKHCLPTEIRERSIKTIFIKTKHGGQ